MVFIYKVWILIQPPGEHYLGEVRPKKFELQSSENHNFYKKLSENVQNLCFFGSCDFNSIFSLKVAISIDPYGQFVFCDFF